MHLIFLEVKVSKFGNGAHALIPKEYSKKKIKIILGNPLKITKYSELELEIIGMLVMKILKIKKKLKAILFCQTLILISIILKYSQI